MSSKPSRFISLTSSRIFFRYFVVVPTRRNPGRITSACSFSPSRSASSQSVSTASIMYRCARTR